MSARSVSRLLAAAFLFIASPLTWAQSATLDAPAQATIGSTISVRWTGPGEQYDQIAVTVPGAADGDKPINTASITSGKNPLPLVMPETPGRYQLRYISRASKAVIGRASIEAVDVETRLVAPELTPELTEVVVEGAEKAAEGQDFRTLTRQMNTGLVAIAKALGKARKKG